MSDFLDAVKGGDASAVRAFLDRDGSLAGQGENGVSPVMLALYHGRRDIARLLIERGAALSFHDACAAGENDRARAMLREDPSLLDRRAPDGYPPLGLAIFFGNRELATLLIAEGADVNAAADNPQRVAPVHAAAAVRDHEILRLLLDRGADPDARQQMDYTPLHTAASRGDREMAELLLARGADRGAIGSDGMTVAGLAAKYGQHEFAQWWDTVNG
ncbi:MAG TPA: ankyrin repeat domain-containing protein [Thermoanaerobaculia bacterium]|nr:ankyrin repeat domain-containing protein [Thermoanaerobaculia bacterium]